MACVCLNMFCPGNLRVLSFCKKGPGCDVNGLSGRSRLRPNVFSVRAAVPSASRQGVSLPSPRLAYLILC